MNTLEVGQCIGAVVIALGGRELLGVAIRRYRTPAESRRLNRREDREDQKVVNDQSNAVITQLQKHVDQLMKDVFDTRIRCGVLEDKNDELTKRIDDCEADRARLHFKVNELSNPSGKPHQ